MKLLRLFLFVLLGLIACSAFAGEFKLGTYVLRDDKGAQLWRLTFYKASEQAQVYRVKGMIAGVIEALNLEIEGTYDPTSNRLRAKTLEIGGFKVLNVDGSWNASENRFYANTDGAPSVKLHYAGSAALAATATFDVKITKAVAGQPLEGTVTVKTKGVLQPYDAQIIVLFAERNNTQRKVNTRVPRDAELVLDLAAHTPITVPSGLNRATLRIALVPLGETLLDVPPMIEYGVDIEGVEDKIYVKQANFIGEGGTAVANIPLMFDLSFVLEHPPTFKGNPNGRKVLWQIAFFPEKGGDPIRANKEIIANSYKPGDNYLGSFAIIDIPPLKPGRYQVVYQASGEDITLFRGQSDITATLDPNDPANKKEVKPGVVSGTLTLSKSSAKIGELIKLTVAYAMKDGEDQTSVNEQVRLISPKGAQVAASLKTVFINADGKRQRVFDIKAAESGTFTIEARVKGEKTSEWKTTGSFTIAKDDKSTPPPKVEKDANFSGEWDTSAGRMTLTQSGNGVKGKYTWMQGTIEGTVKGNKMTFKWSQPRNDRYGTGVFTMSKGGNSFSGDHVYTHPADAAKLDPKPWNGTRVSGTTAPPVTPDDPAEREVESSKPTSTSMTALTSDDDENFQIRARVEPTAITLRAGETSQIVNIIVSGFRTRTEDRVEVVFPQATDGWASLPGQIVVGAGNGSYAPANMDRPEHKDGYFFSARETAPGGTTQIVIIVRQKGAGQARITLDVTVIPKKKADSSTGSKTWSNKYTSRAHPWYELDLTFNGDRFTGTFAKGKGTMQGTVSGKKLTFTFVDAFGTKGFGTFEIEGDGSQILGSYKEEGDDTNYFITMNRG